MFVIQEHFIQPVPAFQALFPVGIAVAQGPVRVHPVYRSRDLFRDQSADLPVGQHGQEILYGILHGHQKAQEDVVGQIVLIQGEQGQDVPSLACHIDGRRAGIPGMAFPDPHFRSEHQKGHIVAPGHADAGGAHIFFQDPHALDVFDAPLEEGQGIVLQHIAVFIHQQHAQVVGIEILLVLFEEPIHIFHHILMDFQGSFQFLRRQPHPMGRHGFMVQFPGFAPAPGLRYPRMDVGIYDSFVNELVVVAGQFFLIASFPNHRFTP